MIIPALSTELKQKSTRFYPGAFLYVSLDNGYVSTQLEGSDKVWGLLLHELYNAVLHGVDGEVCTDFYVLARMDLGTALADQNFTGFDGSAVRALNAKLLGLRISAVSGRTLG